MNKLQCKLQFIIKLILTISYKYIQYNIISVKSMSAHYLFTFSLAHAQYGQNKFTKIHIIVNNIMVVIK